MYGADFLKLLHHQPFKPMRLHLSGGVTFDIRHQELAIVGLSFVEIHLPSTYLSLILGEKSVVVVLSQIIYIEFIGAGTDISAN